MARAIGLDIIAYSVIPIVLIATAGIRRRSNIPNIGIYLIATSNGRYYVYATKPPRILIPSYYLRIYI